MRPTWVTVVGVLMIIFGILGLIGNLQSMFFPKFMGFHETLMGIAKERVEDRSPSKASVIDEIEEMMETPDWFPTWIMIYGFIGAIFMTIYFYAGVALLKMKENAVKIAYLALGLSIIFALVQLVFASYIDSLVAIGIIFGGIVSLVIDLVLLSVIMSHKSDLINRSQQTLTT